MIIEVSDIILVVVMLVFSALFSGIETAFMTANRLKIELKSAQGDSVGNLLSGFVRQTPKVLSTILVGNTVSLVLYGIAMGRLSGSITAGLHWIDPLRQPYLMIAVEASVATLVILYFGEFLPKAFFKIKADQIMFHTVTARLLQFYVRLFSPVVAGVNACARFILRRIIRLRYQEEEQVFSKEDLSSYMQQTLGKETQTDTAPEIDTEMFTNAMAFNERRVKEFMVPRTELRALSVDSTIDELLDYFIEQGHSRILIYGENLDDVLGFVHHSSLFKRPQAIKDILQPMLSVPENMAANLLLSEFTRHRKTMAVVVDEFGGTEGIVTVEDLVEVVFGDIEDEHDEPEEEELLARELGDGKWLFSARHLVADLNVAWELHLPEGEGEYSTLAGLIIHHLEAIPKLNDTLELERYRITVTDASDSKVNIVQVELL
ncbi:MAG: hemolysin family protein [Bacteroidia bacterium]